MSHTVTWPVWIALYLYLAGVSGGAFAASTAASFLGERYRNVTRWGAYIAPWPVLIGTGLLIFDLGSPMKFYLLFLKVNPRSVMSMGAFILSLFGAIAVAHFWHQLYTEKKVKFTLLPDSLVKLIRFLGIPLAVGIGTYTGFLLNASIAVTLWNNGVLPLIFLASALSTGVAAVMVAVALSSKWNTVKDEVRNLAIVDAVLIGLELFALAAYLWSLHVGNLKQQAALDYLNLHYGVWFWGGVITVGLLLPLFLKVFTKGESAAKAALNGTLVLFGGLVLRIVIVIAGQMATPLY
ncbi:MAG TPA: NrfD/PsrC family molybdoenzyme membrane anchor subunit [Symbiobacteriaceae bacterium]|nr:NrfD/PsrC family molybdoenzyme membrane anchor subunit [Symbiobacteriaceae bacterium]